MAFFYLLLCWSMKGIYARNIFLIYLCVQVLDVAQHERGAATLAFNSALLFLRQGSLQAKVLAADGGGGLQLYIGAGNARTRNPWHTVWCRGLQLVQVGVPRAWSPICCDDVMSSNIPSAYSHAKNTNCTGAGHAPRQGRARTSGVQPARDFGVCPYVP